MGTKKSGTSARNRSSATKVASDATRHVPPTLLAALGIVAVCGVVAIAWAMSSKSPAKVTATPKLVRIGLSLDTVQTQRWANERDIMTQTAAGLGSVVTTAIAQGDSKTQSDQIENFVAEKVDVIIVVAVDANGLTTAIADAKKAGIKVIDYDRLTLNSNPDLYISFDSTKVGQEEAQYVVDAIPKTVAVPKIAFVGGSPTDNNATLVRNGAMQVVSPLVAGKKASLVFDKFTSDWSPSTAYTNLKAFLDGGGMVDAVVCSNDGMAAGVIKALKEHGLDGKVPVSGQDGELDAIQQIVAGSQTMTAYKPGRILANKAIEFAIDMANGKSLGTTGTTDNGQIKVPTYLLDPVPVTKATIDDTVVKDGVYTHRQIYNPAG